MIPPRFPELRERSLPLEHPLTRLRVVDPNLGTSENCVEGPYLRVSLVIPGHLHGRFVLRANEKFPLSIANPGSVTASDHERAYHVLTIDRGRIELEARRYDATSRRFTAWPQAPGAGVLRP